MSTDFRANPFISVFRLLDVTAVAVSFLVSFAATSGSFTWLDFADLLVMRIKVGNIVVFAGYLLLCAAIFSALGFYRSHRLSSWKQRICEKSLAVAVITAIFLLLNQLFRISFVTTDFLFLYCLLTLSSLVSSHEIALQVLRLARLRGRNLRHVIIIGEEPDATALAHRISQETRFGYRVLRIIDAREIGDDGGIVGDI
jgi:FlaA1/EpsC-like NDP-sugar epimerase